MRETSVELATRREALTAELPIDDFPSMIVKARFRLLDKLAAVVRWMIDSLIKLGARINPALGNMCLSIV